MRHPITVALLLFATACAANPDAAPAPLPVEQGFRAKRPAAQTSRSFTPPVAHREVLANGLTLLTVEKSNLPLVSLTVIIKSGAAQDPSELPGLAGFLAEVLRSGTKNRSAAAIADELESHGSTLSIGVDQDSMTFTLSALAQNFDAVFAVVADVLQNPAFAADEIERARRKRIAALQQECDDPTRTASKTFRRVLFGKHPYGHQALGDELAVKKIARMDLESFYKAHVRPANAAIVLVGKINAEEATRKTQAFLGGWIGLTGATMPPALAVDAKSEIALIDKPKAPQSELRVGHLGLPRAHPDYFAVQMLNAVLGGMFNSRINMNLREDKGYTYGAFSSFEFWRSRGVFGVGAGVQSDKTALSITEIIREIDKMRRDGVTHDELAGAKQHYALSLPSYFENVNAIGAMVGNLYLFDLPLDYFRTLVAAIDQVTVEQVNHAAAAYLNPAALSIVVVGDAEVIEQSINELKLGAIVRRSTDGIPAGR